MWRSPCTSSLPPLHLLFVARRSRLSVVFMSWSSVLVCFVRPQTPNLLTSPLPVWVCGILFWGGGLRVLAGGKGGGSNEHSMQSKGVSIQIRPSLNHLDAEPCICDVIKVFRQENPGEDFTYQVCAVCENGVCAHARACVFFACSISPPGRARLCMRVQCAQGLRALATAK